MFLKACEFFPISCPIPISRAIDLKGTNAKPSANSAVFSKCCHCLYSSIFSFMCNKFIYFPSITFVHSSSNYYIDTFFRVFIYLLLCFYIYTYSTIIFLNKHIFSINTLYYWHLKTTHSGNSRMRCFY